MRFLVRAILGNLAALLWFLPPLAKALHAWRGVHFDDRASVFLTRHVTMDNRYPELISIGADVWLTQGVRILTHSQSSLYQIEHFGLDEKKAPVRIERGVFIGVDSVILPGVTLGKGCYIAAGSIVTRSVAPGMLAAGNPCREVRALKG